MLTDEEILTSVRPGKPPANCPVLGTWQLRSYVRERLSDGQRHNQFGEAPVGYIGYAPETAGCTPFSRATTAWRRATWCPPTKKACNCSAPWSPMPAPSHWERMSWFTTLTHRGTRHGPAPTRSGTSCWREIR